MDKVIIGIDVSKLKLDLCVQVCGNISQEIVLENTISDLKKFFVKLLKEHSASEVNSKRLKVMLLYRISTNCFALLMALVQ